MLRSTVLSAATFVGGALSSASLTVVGAILGVALVATATVFAAHAVGARLATPEE